MRRRWTAHWACPAATPAGRPDAPCAENVAWATLSAHDLLRPSGRPLLGERAHALLALLAREEPGGEGEHLGELVGQRGRALGAQHLLRRLERAGRAEPQHADVAGDLVVELL